MLTRGMLMSTDLVLNHVLLSSWGPRSMLLSWGRCCCHEVYVVVMRCMLSSWRLFCCHKFYVLDVRSMLMSWGLRCCQEDYLNLNFLRSHIRLDRHSSIGDGLRLHGVPRSRSSSLHCFAQPPPSVVLWAATLPFLPQASIRGPQHSHLLDPSL